MKQNGNHCFMAHTMTIGSIIYSDCHLVIAAKDAEIAALKDLIDMQKRLIAELSKKS